MEAAHQTTFASLVWPFPSGPSSFVFLSSMDLSEARWSPTGQGGDCRLDPSGLLIEQGFHGPVVPVLLASSRRLAM
jgi:hypothetical protein